MENGRWRYQLDRFDYRVEGDYDDERRDAKRSP
jgi:hypothetical protein